MATRLTVFSMFGCGHCHTFVGTPRGSSIWNKLVNDPELVKAGVKFLEYKWGRRRNEKGETVRHALPPNHKGVVNYGPYIELAQMPAPGQAPPVGIPFPRGTQRTFENVKAWVLKSIPLVRWDGRVSAPQQSPVPVQSQPPAPTGPSQGEVVRRRPRRQEQQPQPSPAKPVVARFLPSK